MNLQVQIKATPHGLVVIDPGGEMHPCFDSEELWDCLEGMVDGTQDWKRPAEIVAESVLLQVKGRRDALVVIDPNADIHPCQDDVELWEVVHAILRTAPAMETSPALVPYRPAAPTRVEHRDAQVIYDDDDVDDEDDEYLDPEEMIMDLAVDLSTKIFSSMRQLSHRGPKPKVGSRRTKRVKRGDIY